MALILLKYGVFVDIPANFMDHVSIKILGFAAIILQNERIYSPKSPVGGIFSGWNPGIPHIYGPKGP